MAKWQTGDFCPVNIINCRTPVLKSVKNVSLNMV